MAIDTREKRFSMLNFGDGNHWHATFEADSSVDLDDKQHLLDCYSGIAFASTAVGQPFYVRDSYTMPDFLGNMQA